MEFCTDETLAYAGSRHAFAAGRPFALGADYRLAHLPLVAPGHPEAIASVDGRDYLNGRYATARDALCVRVSADLLEAAPAFREIEAALRASRFARKIAWDIGPRRRDVLHATVAGPADAATTARTAAATAAFVRRHGPVAFRLGGPFVGNRNHGRVYLPVYPQILDGDDAFGLLLDACGRPRTRFYAAGIWHLRDGLDADEAASLGALVDKWSGREILRVPEARFGILSVNDDLALDGATWRWIDSRG
ncbi:MAG: hypothetical protein JNL71_02300 [Rhodospirillales bacterium]|nr:hypothetical protein [Rhodospirillales bacterium]